MFANRRVPSMIVATAVTLGLMACSTPPLRTVVMEADVAKASAVDQTRLLERLYWMADANHDWHLTREEARQRLAITYREFDEIDARKRGWISLKQYLAFHEARIKRPDEVPHIGNPR